jgi:hypothetical protein
MPVEGREFREVLAESLCAVRNDAPLLETTEDVDATDIRCGWVAVIRVVIARDRFDGSA